VEAWADSLPPIARAAPLPEEERLWSSTFVKCFWRSRLSRPRKPPVRPPKLSGPGSPEDSTLWQCDWEVPGIEHIELVMITIAQVRSLSLCWLCLGWLTTCVLPDTCLQVAGLVVTLGMLASALLCCSAT
jgi:hypothetical protein